jgi:hypothetical protein
MNVTTFQCIRKQPTLITDHSSRGANTNACHVLGFVAPGAPIQFSVRICHIFVQSCVHQWEDSGKALVLAASSKFLCTVSGQTPTDYSKNLVPQFILHWTRAKMLEKRTKQTRGRKHLMLPWTRNTVHHPSPAWQLC